MTDKERQWRRWESSRLRYVGKAARRRLPDGAGLTRKRQRTGSVSTDLVRSSKSVEQGDTGRI